MMKNVIFEKLGKTLKIYNEMKYIDGEDKLQNYFLEKKNFFYIKLFYFILKINIIIKKKLLTI